MNTVFALLTIMAVAAALGHAVYARRANIGSTAWWLISSMIFAVTLSVLWAFFHYQTDDVLASNDPIFGERISYFIVITDKAEPVNGAGAVVDRADKFTRSVADNAKDGARLSRANLIPIIFQESRLVSNGSGGATGKPGTTGPIKQVWKVSVQVTAPAAIRIDDDAAFELTIHSQVSAVTGADFQSLLHFGDDIKSRTDARCSPPAGSSKEVPLTLCAKGTEGYSVRWYLRSKKTGKSYITIDLPSDIKVDLSQHKASWYAVVSHERQILNCSAPVSDAWSISAPEFLFVSNGSVGPTGPPLFASDANPVLKCPDIEVDLRNLRVTLPAEFKNTLGFTAPTYERLTIAGSFAAAFLGAGWIWPLISLLRERRGHDVARRPWRGRQD